MATVGWHKGGTSLRKFSAIRVVSAGMALAFTAAMSARLLFAAFAVFASAAFAGAGCGGSTSHEGPAATGGSTTGGAPGNGGRVTTGGSAGGQPATGGSGADFCNGPNDCALISAGCCAGCEPVSASDLTSINVEHLNDRQCDVACAPCPPLGPGERPTEQYFKPGCEAHHCTIIDIRETEVASCQRDSDCMLRLGASCCERCAGEPVAVNRNADLVGFFCPAGPTPCPACVPQLPAGYESACVQGRCTVVEPACTASHPCP